MPEEEPNKDKAHSSSAALEKLIEQRAAKRKLEETELEEKRLKAGYKAEAEAPNFAKQNKKPIIILSVTAVLIAVIYQVGVTVYETLSPSWLIEDYEKAVSERRHEDAAVLIKKYLELQPEDWDKTAEAAELLLVLGEQSEARTLLSRLISNSPLSGNAEILFLSALSNLPNIVQASTKSTEILLTLDSFVPSLVFRGLLEAESFPDQSAEDFAAAVSQVQRLQPNQEKHQRYQQLLALFTRVMCREIPEKVDKYVNLNFEHYPKEFPHEKYFYIYGIDSALSMNFCGLVSEDAFTPDLEALVHFYNAYTATLLGDIEAANVAIGKSAGNANLNVASFLDGVLQSYAGNFTDAKRSWQRTGGTSDFATQSNIAVAELLSGIDEWDSAHETLGNVLADHPNSFRALNNRAVLSIIKDRFSQARSDLNLASRQNNDAHPVYNLALLDYLEGNKEQALANFTSILGEVELFPGLHFYLGSLYGGAGSTERSLTNYRSALEYESFSVLANIALGDFYGRQELTSDVSMNYYQAAYDLNNNSFEAAIKLADARARAGESQNALSFIETLADKYTDLNDEQVKNDFNDLYLSTRASILYAEGSPEAEEALSKATNEITQNDDLRIASAIKYSKLLLTKNDEEATREALDITRTMLPLSPQNVDLLIARSNALIKARDINQALSIIDTALEIDRNNPEALVTKAEILAKDQRWELAVEHYQAAFTSDPSDVAPLDAAIVLLESLGKEGLLLDQLKELKVAVVENQEELKRLALVEDDGINTSPLEKVDLRIGLTERATTEDEKAAVRVKIQEINALLNDNQIDAFGGYVHLGALYTQLNQIEQAIKNMELATAAENIPVGEEYKPWLNLSQLYILAANYKAADGSLSKAMDLNPGDSARLLMLRAGIREHLNPYDAIADYDLVIEQLPNQFDALYRRGINKLNLEDAKGAIEDFSQAIKINPEAIEVYQARRSAYGLVGERQKAAQDVEMINILSAKQSESQ